MRDLLAFSLPVYCQKTQDYWLCNHSQKVKQGIKESFQDVKYFASFSLLTPTCAIFFRIFVLSYCDWVLFFVVNFVILHDNFYFDWLLFLIGTLLITKLRLENNMLCLQKNRSWTLWTLFHLSCQQVFSLY